MIISYRLIKGGVMVRAIPVSAPVILTVDEFLDACSKKPGLVGDTRPALFPLVSSLGVQAEWKWAGVA